MVFGTFDIFHPGHASFFKQAKSLAKNPFLIVSIARDANVKKIKGKKPLNSQKIRKNNVEKALKQFLNLPHKVVLGSKDNYISHILKEKPGIIALGYDQKAYTKNLSALLKQAGLGVKVRRLKPFKPNVYKSSLFKKKVV